MAQSAERPPQVDRDIGAEWIIHFYRETQLQIIKGSCEQLNPNKTLIRIWSCSVHCKGACAVSVLMHTHSHQHQPWAHRRPLLSSKKLSQNHLLGTQSLWWQGCLYLSGVNKFNSGWRWHLASVRSPFWQHVLCGAAAIERRSWSQWMLLQDVWLKVPRGNSHISLHNAN